MFPVLYLWFTEFISGNIYLCFVQLYAEYKKYTQTDRQDKVRNSMLPAGYDNFEYFNLLVSMINYLLGSFWTSKPLTSQAAAVGRASSSIFSQN